MIWTFIGITALLYGLVYLLPGSKTPKLGIDLQGGTRVTLQAQTVDGSDPSRAAMNQARDIMERRVNGSGVVGAQVQVDGASQLVVTVPGDANLDNLTRSAVMNIRPVVAAYPTGLVITPTTGTETSGSGAESSGPATSGSQDSLGEPSATPTGTATSGSRASATAGAGPTGTSAPATTAEGTTASGDGLRARQGAVATTASGEETSTGSEHCDR